MMLIEGMKKLRLIEKKMSGNATDITRYSSMVSTERPYFASEEEQKREVAGLVQSNVDLMNEYLTLKRQIEYTNLVVYIRMGDREYSISELLVMKRKMAQQMVVTFLAMNDQAGQTRLRNATGTTDKQPQVVRLYDESYKNNNLRMWQDLYHEIDSRLEVVNATTVLMPAPSREDGQVSVGPH